MLAEAEEEHSRGLGIHQAGSVDIVRGRIICDALTEVGVAAPGCIALGDVQGPHGNPAVERAVHDHPHRVDGLVVGRGAVARRTDHTVLGQHHVEIDRTGTGSPHAHDIPQTRVGLHFVLVDEEDGEVGIVSVKARACRLGRHPAGLAAGGGERGTLLDMPAAVDPLNAGDLRIPEVATRFRIGVGGRTDHDVGVDAGKEFLYGPIVTGPEQKRRETGHVHHEDHPGRWTAVTGDGLSDHREARVILATSTPLLGHDAAEQPQLGQSLHALPGVSARLVAPGRVGTKDIVAHLDELALELLLLIGEEPLGVEFVIQTIVGLSAPELRVVHLSLQRWSISLLRPTRTSSFLDVIRGKQRGRPDTDVPQNTIGLMRPPTRCRSRLFNSRDGNLAGSRGTRGPCLPDRHCAASRTLGALRVSHLESARDPHRALRSTDEVVHEIAAQTHLFEVTPAHLDQPDVVLDREDVLVVVHVDQ